MRSVRLWVKIFSSSMLIILLGMGVVAVFMGIYMKDMVLRHETALLENSARSYARGIEEYLARISTLSFDVIYSSEIQGLALRGEPIAAGKIGFESAAAQCSSYLCLTDTEGRVIYELGTANDKDSHWMPPSDTAMGGYLTGVSMVKNVSPHNNYLRVASYYQRAMYLDDRQMIDAGMLRIDVAEMALRSLYLSSPYKCLLVDDGGNVASATDTSLSGKALQTFWGKETADNILGGSAVFFTPTDGGDVYFSSVKIPGSDWHFVSYTGASSLLSGFNSSLTLLILAFSACMVVLIASILVESLCITGPLRKLSDKINRYYSDIEGTKAPQPQKKLDEVGILKYSFENMKDRIDILINQIYAVRMEELDSRLRFLQAQINPHFLYNTLESIRFTARLNGDGQTETQIKALSSIVRGMLSKDSFSTFREEADMAEKYLFLQKQRIGDNLTAHMNISPESLGCQVPRLLLQPLIENCIEHGFSGEGMEIRISARVEEDVLLICVEDNGVGADPTKVEELLNRTDAEKHVALCNINKRLQLYYGKNFGLSFNEVHPHGAAVTLTMPAKRKE